MVKNSMIKIILSAAILQGSLPSGAYSTRPSSNQARPEKTSSGWSLLEWLVWLVERGAPEEGRQRAQTRARDDRDEQPQIASRPPFFSTGRTSGQRDIMGDRFFKDLD